MTRRKFLLRTTAAGVVAAASLRIAHAQGGDLGAGVSTVLAPRHSHRIIGAHLNYITGTYRPYLPPSESPTETEERFLASVEKFREWLDVAY